MEVENLTQEEIEKQQTQLWNEVAAERSGDQPVVKQPIEAAPVAAEATPPIEEKKPEVQAESEKPDPLLEIAARLESIEKRTRNTEGHIGTLNKNQQQMHELISASKEASAQVDSAPTQKQVQEAMKNPVEWDSLKGEFPEWADATEKFLDAKLSGIKPAGIDPLELERIVNERVAHQTKAVRDEMIESTLDVVLPNWQEEINTKEFDAWIKAQNAEVQALENSSKISDAAKMLRMYSASKVANPAADIIAARQATLNNATSIGKGKNVPKAKSTEDMTPQELWDYEAKLREKRQGLR